MGTEIKIIREEEGTWRCCEMSQSDEKVSNLPAPTNPRVIAGGIYASLDNLYLL